MQNKITDLRDHLFAQLNKLSTADEKHIQNEVTRANAMCDLANCIIDSARAETEFLNVMAGPGTDFMSSGDQQRQLGKAS